ncbi:hypothetical protein BG004_007303 [Podila humilis]|nr:hypothetical protein BG004_007303 [Podila humilis]
MDDLYDATFYTWLRSEDNVLVTASYLQRLTGEYSLDRIEHALCWLVNGWRLESIAILVKQVTFDWIATKGDQGEIDRAQLVLALTDNWAIQFLTRLACTLLTNATTLPAPPSSEGLPPASHSTSPSPLSPQPLSPHTNTSTGHHSGYSVRPYTHSSSASSPSSPTPQATSTFLHLGPAQIHSRRMAISRRVGSPLIQPNVASPPATSVAMPDAGSSRSHLASSRAQASAMLSGSASHVRNTQVYSTSIHQHQHPSHPHHRCSATHRHHADATHHGPSQHPPSSQADLRHYGGHSPQLPRTAHASPSSKTQWTKHSSTYITAPVFYMNKSLFMEELSRKWSFCRLSEFFQCMDPNSGISHRFKCTLLKEQALKEEIKKAASAGHALSSEGAATSIPTPSTSSSSSPSPSPSPAATASESGTVSLSTTIAPSSAQPSDDQAMTEAQLKSVPQAENPSDETDSRQPPRDGQLSRADNSEGSTTDDIHMKDDVDTSVESASTQDTPLQSISTPSSSQCPESLHPFDMPTQAMDGAVLTALRQEFNHFSSRQIQNGSGQSQAAAESTHSGRSGSYSTPISPIASSAGSHNPFSESVVVCVPEESVARETASLSDELPHQRPGQTRRPSTHMSCSNTAATAQQQIQYQSIQAYAHNDYNDDMHSGLNRGFKSSDNNTNGHQHVRSQTVDAIMTNPMSASGSNASSYAASAASASLSTLTLTESDERTTPPRRLLPPRHLQQPGLYRHASTLSVPFSSMISMADGASSSTTSTNSATHSSASATTVARLNIHSSPAGATARERHDSTSAKRKNSLGVNLSNASFASTSASSSSAMHSSTTVALSSSSAIFPGPRRTSTSASTTNEDLKRVRCSRQQSNGASGV